MAKSFKLSAWVPLLLFFFLASLYGSCSGLSNRRLDRAGLQRLRRFQIPNCGDLNSVSDCSRNSKCKWCRSEALDDACFSKTEAWRLPKQVFSCD